MHGSRSKIPTKNLVQQRCAEGFNSGVRGFVLRQTQCLLQLKIYRACAWSMRERLGHAWWDNFLSWRTLYGKSNVYTVSLFLQRYYVSKLGTFRWLRVYYTFVTALYTQWCAQIREVSTSAKRKYTNYTNVHENSPWYYFFTWEKSKNVSNFRGYLCVT
jgi:hypothetical protein